MEKNVIRWRRGTSTLRLGEREIFRDHRRRRRPSSGLSTSSTSRVTSLLFLSPLSNKTIKPPSSSTTSSFALAPSAPLEDGEHPSEARSRPGESPEHGQRPRGPTRGRFFPFFFNAALLLLLSPTIYSSNAIGPARRHPLPVSLFPASRRHPCCPRGLFYHPAVLCDRRWLEDARNPRTIFVVRFSERLSRLPRFSLSFARCSLAFFLLLMLSSSSPSSLPPLTSRPLSNTPTNKQTHE